MSLSIVRISDALTRRTVTPVAAVVDAGTVVATHAEGGAEDEVTAAPVAKKTRKTAAKKSGR